ncbi:hypothetical protein M9Y10_034434 [Tritrichomonas musculus]|uniref:BACK domain-containing protein n=1 Tax=Tritrichomonas musculus TaxID=1915356 RepID=A0ABR2KFM6_9EUKA
MNSTTTSMINDASQKRKKFIYNDKEYPIKYNLFKKVSKYFAKNHKLESIENINIIDEGEKSINITLNEDSIDTFIRFCQNSNYEITRENVISLQYLSKKYEVPDLDTYSKRFIQEHSDDILIQYLSNIQDLQKEDNYILETHISMNLMNYIDDEIFLTIPVPFMYRIIEKYENKNDAKVIELLFRYLEKHGRKASALFLLTNCCDNRKMISDRLYSEYLQIFDFTFIQNNPDEFKKQREQEKLNENLKLTCYVLFLTLLIFSFPIFANIIDDLGEIEENIFPMNIIKNLKTNLQKVLFISIARKIQHEKKEIKENIKETTPPKSGQTISQFNTDISINIDNVQLFKRVVSGNNCYYTDKYVKKFKDM